MAGDKKTLGFLGCGQMAQALAGGFLRAGEATSATVVASDTSESARDAFAQKTGGTVLTDNCEVVRRADVIFLAVKPQAMAGLLTEISSTVEDRHCIVSIAAGITLARLADALGQGRRLIRVMPNTPCLVGASASGLSTSPSATTEDAALIKKLMATVGTVVELPESVLDAVTGLSGSGPAFVYLMIEALSDGGVKTGLPRDVATALAAMTVHGAAKMVLETGKHPGELKDAVASPAGTTIAGLAVLEARAVRGALIDAVVAAANRAGELR